MDVVVFSYNRADKLKLCLESIDLSRTDTLWLFCDGAKTLAHVDDVQRNRDVAINFPWDKKHVVLRPSNFGTPRNVIAGLDEVFRTTDRCLILEDDCILRNDAYAYVAWALDRFQNDRSIFSVNTMAPLSGTLNRLASALMRSDIVALSRVFAFWGWATWADRWHEFRPRLEPFANPYGTARNIPQSYGAHVRWTLEQYEKGKVGGWDARLMVLCGHANRFHVHPMISLMRNIGLDGTGSHFRASHPRIEALSALQWSNGCLRLKTADDVRETRLLRIMLRLASLATYVRSTLARILPAPLVSQLRKLRGKNRIHAQW